MKKLIYVLIFPLLAGLVYACSAGKNTIEVVNKNFTDEINTRQNLVITFNQSLAPDSLLGKWTTQKYLKISPEIEGKFIWTDRNELTFSPLEGFRPATKYTAELTHEITRLTSESVLGEVRNFGFRTPNVALKDKFINWRADKQGNPQLTINLEFNYSITPEELVNKVKLKVNDKPLKYKVESHKSPNLVRLVINENDAPNLESKVLNVEIDRGIVPVGGIEPSNPIQFETEILEKSNFTVLEAYAEFDNTESYIVISTTQEIKNSTSQIQDLVAISPKIPFTVEKMDRGFILKGKFREGKQYDLKISKKLTGIFGKNLSNEVTQYVMFGKAEPKIRFSSKKSMYLTSKGKKNVALHIINIPEVTVSIFKIYENNITHFLRNNSYYLEHYPEYISDPTYYGDLISEKTYTTKSLPKNGDERVINLNFTDNKPFKGFYMVKVNSNKQQWVKDISVVSMSDIGFIAKHSKNDILVFANSILTAEPLEGIKVKLVSSNNQQMMQAETDADGVAKFINFREKDTDFKPEIITGEKDGDFNFIRFDDNQVYTARYDVGGERINEIGLKAFIYEERNLYRPGETINLKTIIRDEKWGLVGKIPIKMKILLPNGKAFVTKKGMLSEQGSFETSIPLSASGVTGSYEVQVFSSNDILLNSKYISVEEFVPDRIKVTSEISKKDFSAGEKVSVSAQALNLFGPPAANRNYEIELSLKRKIFQPKNLGLYNFNLEGRTDVKFESIVRDGRKTDSEGKISEEFQLPQKYKNIGILEGKVYTTVFDESGRSVSSLSKFDVLTQKIFYGIKNFDYYVGTRKALNIPLVAVNQKGEIAKSTQARVKLVRFEWQNVLEKHHNSYRYVSQKKEKIISDVVITLNGKSTTYPIVPRISGEYELRVSLPNEDKSYVKRRFYAYTYGSTANSSFEIDKEGQIQITPAKTKYQVGEEAEVLLTTPFEGKVLVTIERNQVFDYFFVNTNKKSVALKIPIKEEYLPNFYVTTTLIKPASNSAIPITVAHGFQGIKVENKSHKLEVKITAPEKSRSNRKQEFMIQTSQPNAEVTVAVVDEGILQQKNYQTPNPYSFFFKKRALEVCSYDIYPRIFPELNNLQRNFGSGAYNIVKRVNPLSNKRIKPISFWSGTLKTDANGIAKYSINLPQFSGDVRIMAVATKNKAFGSTHTNMKVADPMVVSTSLPLFLSPNDITTVPVMLTNTTDKNAEGVVKLSVKGKVLKIDGNASAKVVIPAKSEKQLFFKVKAKNAIGTATVQTEVTAMGEKFTEKIEMGVRPSTSLLKQSDGGMIGTNQSKKLDFGGGFVQSSLDGKLILSKSPAVELAKNLDYLVRYPHGCVEQTVSTAFPQLYFSALTQKVISEKDKNTDFDPNQNVQFAIQKLQTMQLWNGSLSYWQGGDYESWWGSVYAAHFLIEARRAGFDVDNRFLESLLDYLSNKSKRKKAVAYKIINVSNQQISRNIAPKEIFYSLYVLALNGQQDLATMNYYKANRKLLAMDSRYLLAITYLMTGDKVSFRSILPNKFYGEKSVSTMSGSFHSYIRDMAISLNALIDGDSENNQIPILARQLSKQMKAQKYLNTQERAFGLLALGKLAKKAHVTPTKAEIFANGKKIADFSDADLTLDKAILGKNVEIKVREGNLYFFKELEGLSTTGNYLEEDNFIKVRREFYDRNGKRISGNTFKQNDLIIVKISVETTYSGGNVPNVVITDMLPAGFEIENPRIGAVAGQNWIKDASKPQHFDFRDDRVNLFTTVSPKMRSFYYTVRAVSKGKFQQGPVSADAMYDGSYHSYHGAGTIIVN